MSATPDYDAIVVGAGHNGLAATALLCKQGLRVLCLEKNGYAGGMAGTRVVPFSSLRKLLQAELTHDVQHTESPFVSGISRRLWGCLHQVLFEQRAK